MIDGPKQIARLAASEIWASAVRPSLVMLSTVGLSRVFLFEKVLFVSTDLNFTDGISCWRSEPRGAFAALSCASFPSFPMLNKDRAQDVRNGSHDYLTQPVGHILRTKTGTRGYYESGITEPTSS